MAKVSGWTSKRERFCRLIVFQGMTASQAYQRAYDVKPDTKPASIWVQASKLRKVPEVAERIEQLQKELYKDDLVEGKLSLETHLANLKELRDLAVDLQQPSAAIAGEIARGRASGLYVEKSVVAEVSLADLVGKPGPKPPNTKKPPAVKPGADSKRRSR